MQMMMKCADISHPARQWKVHERWSLLICEEFYRQGALPVPVALCCQARA